MENSIIKTIRLNLLEDTNDLDLLLEQKVKSIPTGYEVSQITRLGSHNDTGIFAIVFNKEPSQATGGLPKSVPTPKGLQDSSPSAKQIKYLTFLVDSLQPEDFPGIDEITTSKLAGQWIKKLKNMQKEE